MIINGESYVPQAITWINESVATVLENPHTVLDPEEIANQKALFADTLVQIEMAKQLKRIADSLDQLVRSQHR